MALDLKISGFGFENISPVDIAIPHVDSCGPGIARMRFKLSQNAAPCIAVATWLRYSEYMRTKQFRNTEC